MLSHQSTHHPSSLPGGSAPTLRNFAISIDVLSTVTLGGGGGEGYNLVAKIKVVVKKLYRNFFIPTSGHLPPAFSLGPLNGRG